ncbi:MAG TPA: hypothetical protein VEW46_00005, partial [Pyrinomonadaceae bacterium]|nr:hypothetical protein [Pyrinomonadaceae bacterium]
MQEIDQTANPFPGLRPFESSETHLFFGRDGQSEELLRRLKRTRFLAVVGTSGSGKSSLVRAGLLPALQGGLMASAGSDWRIAILRPGGDPIGNLARALASSLVLGSPDEKTDDMQAVLAETNLRRSSLGLVELVTRARTKVDEKGQQLFADYENLLVVVDQFEELFRFKQLIEEENSKEDAAAFVKLLLEAVGQKTEKIYVVLTMRSDFLGDCSQFFELPEAINNGQYLIPRMTRDERREAISGPVAVAKGTISEPLVSQLLNDVGDNPDQLPIMQHALMRTWDHWLTHRNGKPIDIPDYNAIGGMAEALSRHADEAYAELDEREKAIAEKLFKGLTEKGTDNREIRRPMEVQEICELTGADEAAVIQVVEVFRREDRSFLMPPPTDPLTGARVNLNSESLIDISHESLIRNWERLKAWVDEEAQSARIYKRLSETAMLHKADQEALLMDPALQGTLDWREKNNPNVAWARRYHPEFETAMSYLEQSVAARDAERCAREQQRRKDVSFKRTKLAAIFLALSFLLSLTASVYAYRKGVQARAELGRAQAALADSNTALAEAGKARAQAVDALFEAKQARAFADQRANNALESEAKARARETSARASEARARQSEARANFALREARSQTLAAQNAAEQNRQFLYSSDINLAQQAYETGNLERAGDLLVVHKPYGPNPANFEWNYLNHLLHSEKATLEAPDKGSVTIVSSLDGGTLAIGAGQKIEIRNLAAGETKSTVIRISDDNTPDEQFSVGALAISGDGKLLAVSNGTAFAAVDDEAVEAAKREKIIVKLFDIRSGRETRSLKSSKGFFATAILFTADGERLVVGGHGGPVQLWEVNSERTPGVIPSQGVTDLAISRDGAMLAFSSIESVYSENPIVLWDVASNKEVRRLTGHDSTVSSMVFMGESLISGSLDKTVRVWDIASGKQQLSIHHPSEVSSLALSPEGRFLAIGYQDGPARLCFTNDLFELDCATLKGHQQAVSSLAFSARSRLLFSTDSPFGNHDKGSPESGPAVETTIKSWEVAALV